MYRTLLSNKQTSYASVSMEVSIGVVNEGFIAAPKTVGGSRKESRPIESRKVAGKVQTTYRLSREWFEQERMTNVYNLYVRRA